ncbi:Desert hedgehog protein [Galdieria sulphuraria]|uniref:Hedgehog n=1 Tax=Galdieria sulphuraria TaxID=130081 RepID=M2W5U3_GALSU|nr:hedgehog [Galdieria sulphuraria]EME31146.1 hedgehog [Galdieria sulphuraria]GJD12384.1 Desert hedgehog protein [Galdieria sulphuraria]|eukprot:XP_005707666.1 hedgehog [Galdieria sulphuraria]
MSLIRSSDIPLSISYYSSSSSCQGSPTIADTIQVDDSSLETPISLYELFNKYLGISVPSEAEDVTAQITGCGNNMNLKLCYSSSCKTIPLNDCIDIDQVVKDLIGFNPFGDLGSIDIGLTGPSCSSGIHCFSADSKVSLDDFQEIDMRFLRVGHKIFTYDTQLHKTRKTEVIGWLDKRDDIAVSFLHITHEMGHLKVSPYHLLMRVGSNNQVDHVYAKDIKIGDQFFFYNTSHSKSSQVTYIQQVREVGAFAPLTLDGTYLVNGVLVSCYAHFASHKMAHVAFAPYRRYHLLFGKLFRSQLGHYIQLLKSISKWSSNFRLSKGIIA